MVKLFQHLGLGVAALALLTSGCTTDEEASTASGPTPTAASSAPLEFRRVLAAGPGTGPWCADDSTGPGSHTPAPSSGATDPPGEVVCRAYADFSCPSSSDDSHAPYLLACESGRVESKYLLAEADIVGGVLSAEPGIPQGQVEWVVNIELDAEASKKFEELSRDLVDTNQRFALVLDGEVLSAPTMHAVITNGRSQISGDFTQQDAAALAARLRGDEA